MPQSTVGGFQDGFIEIVEEQLKLCVQQVDDFDQQIEGKQKEITYLRAERATAAKRAQQLEILLQDSDADDEQPTTPSAGPQPGRPIADADAVVTLIRENGEAMHYLDIHRTLVARGFEIGGEGKADTLLSRYFKDSRLTRVSRGTYGLAGNQGVKPAVNSDAKTAFSVPGRLSRQRPTLPTPPVRGLNSRMKVVEMVAETLRQAEEPLHYREITERILQTGVWNTKGKTPQDTVNSAMVIDMREHGDMSTFIRERRGVYRLRERKEDVS